MDDNINFEYISEYIRSVIPDNNDNVLNDMEIYAKEYNIPIVQPEAARLIYIIAKIKKPKKVLEIGTAIGYSAIILSKALKDNGKIITIEKNKDMAKIAEENVKRANLKDTIQIKCGDALDTISEMTEHFDYIFLDAAKGQYLNFLPYCIKLLKKDGILVSDNVLFKGMVAANKLVRRRKRTIVKRLRQYLYEINNNTELETSVIPIGDGISISIKK